jgi:hypothetical protein
MLHLSKRDRYKVSRGFECMGITSAGGSASETTQLLSPVNRVLAPVHCAGISAMPERASGINADELAMKLRLRSRTLPESETRGGMSLKEQILAKTVLSKPSSIGACVSSRLPSFGRTCPHLGTRIGAVTSKLLPFSFGPSGHRHASCVADK